MATDPLNFHEFMPEDVWKWKLLEQQLDGVLAMHDYEEIRLSVLQDYRVLRDGITALMHGHKAEEVVDNTLNLSQPDNDISLLSLRPEGTISVLHHTARIYKKGEIHRFYYHGPMFRKDKNHQPMEFYQLGVEMLGSDSILSENEVISLGIKLCEGIGLGDVSLKLNSYGCEECRQSYFADLKAYLDDHSAAYCTACIENLKTNPFEDTRCLDPKCVHDVSKGPQITKYLCPKCKDNFQKIKKIQANLGHRYGVDPYLFKNFAYYNETVFDFVIRHGGSEIIVGGGGRYDYLSELITNKKIPAVGFYINLDTVFHILEERGGFGTSTKSFSVYISSQSPEMEMMMLQIAHELHSQRIRTVIGAEITSTEKELSRARKKGCALMILIREENIREGKILLNNLGKEHQEYVALDHIIEAVQIARKALNME
ncbi:MAG: ATP phosphoribosyltransferase regulatory subunit [Candidatus Cloacimonadaceae bacterium]|nr:ATP phosphoribosyltransferase regulatory subunit [Candidatus Cloacimonadaceae bacterium]